VQYFKTCFLMHPVNGGGGSHLQTADAVKCSHRHTALPDNKSHL